MWSLPRAAPQADTLPVNCYRHMLFLVSVDPDNHPHSSPVFVIGDFQHLYLPESSAPAGRADKTAMGL